MQLTVLVLPDAQASSSVGCHNLDAISDALIRKGIGVTTARDSDFVKGFGEDSAWQELQVGPSLRRMLIGSIYISSLPVTRLSHVPDMLENDIDSA